MSRIPKKPVASIASRSLMRSDYLSHDTDTTLIQVLVYVDNSNARMRKMRLATFHRLGISIACHEGAQGDEYDIHPIGDAHGGKHADTLAMRVYSTASALDDMLVCPFVKSWHAVSTAQVPMRERLDEGGIPYVLQVKAQGSGAEKMRKKPCTIMTTAQDVDYDSPALRSNRSGDEDKYRDNRRKEKRSAVSATQYDSLRDAIRDSANTDLPK